jgi:hypothetical protein
MSEPIRLEQSLVNEPAARAACGLLLAEKGPEAVIGFIRLASGFQPSDQLRSELPASGAAAYLKKRADGRLEVSVGIRKIVARMEIPVACGASMHRHAVSM